MSVVESLGGLTGELLRIAAEPTKVDALYERLGEFCHQIRNRLNSLKLSIYLARRGGWGAGDERWAALERRYRALELFIEQFQTICRPISLSPFRVALGLLMDERFEAWSRLLSPNEIELILAPPRETVIGLFDAIRLGQGLDALVAWRSEAAAPRSVVQVEWWGDETNLAIEWSESPPPGAVIGAPAVESSAPLALPLLGRILSAHRGSLAVSLDEGFRMSLRWPLDARAP
jgi:hypothetical protein